MSVLGQRGGSVVDGKWYAGIFASGLGYGLAEV